MVRSTFPSLFLILQASAAEPEHWLLLNVRKCCFRLLIAPGACGSIFPIASPTSTSCRAHRCWRFAMWTSVCLSLTECLSEHLVGMHNPSTNNRCQSSRWRVVCLVLFGFLSQCSQLIDNIDWLGRYHATHSDQSSGWRMIPMTVCPRCTCFL
jgi:hypothetical protein